MGVVHLDTDIVRKSSPRLFELDKPPQDILQTCRSPEVLLLKSKQFTLVHVVVGVQDLGDIADFAGSVDTSLVVSCVERVEVKARDGSCLPKSNIGAILGCVSRNRRIVGDGIAFHASGPHCLVGISDIFDVTIESDGVRDIISSNFPGLSSVSDQKLRADDLRSPGPAMDQGPRAVHQN